MNLLLSMLADHLLPALEAAFVAHEPEMQEALLKELGDLSSKVMNWIDSKAKPEVPHIA